MITKTLDLKYVMIICLKASIPDPPEMNPRLATLKERQRKFLEQLMDGSKVESYLVSVPVEADLRKYQQVDRKSVSLFLKNYFCNLNKLK